MEHRVLGCGEVLQQGNLDRIVGPLGHSGAMADWQRFCIDAPELSAEVRRRFDAHGHKTMATLREQLSRPVDQDLYAAVSAG